MHQTCLDGLHANIHHKGVGLEGLCAPDFIDVRGLDLVRFVQQLDAVDTRLLVARNTFVLVVQSALHTAKVADQPARWSELGVAVHERLAIVATLRVHVDRGVEV